MEITEDIVHLIQAAFTEDLGEDGDVTSALTIPEDKIITTTMNAREMGVIAGIPLAIEVFKTFDDTLDIQTFMEDGSKVSPKQKILSVTGKARSILSAERVALNFISHLSAIATQTATYVEAVKGTNARIFDTRKTLPAYRALQKYAVKMGGGTNHRIGLYDMILIKDNHIAAAGSVKAALDAVQNTKNLKIEIEVDTLEQLDEVLTHGGADIVLLDNMNPDMLKIAVEKVNGQMLTEASGGINMDSVRAIAQSGVDYISIGALTHSVKVFDIGLDIGE